MNLLEMFNQLTEEQKIEFASKLIKYMYFEDKNGNKIPCFFQSNEINNKKNEN